VAVLQGLAPLISHAAVAGGASASGGAGHHHSHLQRLLRGVRPAAVPSVAEGTQTWQTGSADAAPVHQAVQKDGVRLQVRGSCGQHWWGVCCTMCCRWMSGTPALAHSACLHPMSLRRSCRCWHQHPSPLTYDLLQASGEAVYAADVCAGNSQLLFAAGAWRPHMSPSALRVHACGRTCTCSSELAWEASVPMGRASVPRAVVKSAHARARITRIDASAALALPGVTAWLSVKDIPAAGRNLVYTEPLFADGEVGAGCVMACRQRVPRGGGGGQHIVP
jgi:hypothetical protein